MITITCWLTSDGQNTELWMGPRPEFRKGRWTSTGTYLGNLPKSCKVRITPGESPKQLILTEAENVGK